MIRLQGVIAAVLCSLIFCGCQSTDDAAKRRAERATEHFKKLSERTLNQDKLYTLPECINDALKHNLDLQVEKLQAAIAKERKTATMLQMLPHLTYEYNITSRSNQPGSKSIDIRTDDESLETSRSSKKVTNTNKVELALSVMDFGIAYMNSIQAEDAILLAENQERRLAQNLSYEVAKTYFEVATIQSAITETTELLERCRGIETIFDNLKSSKNLSANRILMERRRFVNLEKSLMYYRRNYETSCVRLRTLMGYLPLEKIQVNTDFLNNYNIQQVPAVDQLEELAVRNRPELSRLDIESHINLIEIRKSIVQMFPNVKLFTDWQHSSNPFLYNQSWWEIGCKAAYDLLKLPSKVMTTVGHYKQSEVLEMRTKALSLAVMAQVRIAHANLQEMHKMYNFRSKICDIYEQSLQLAKNSYDAGGSSLSRFDLDRLELETAEKKIQKVRALGSCYLAYYRLLNTVGVRSFDLHKKEVAANNIQTEK